MSNMIKRAWKLHRQFQRAMSSRRDVQMQTIENERLLTPYIDRMRPQGVDKLASKLPGQILAAQWLRRLRADYSGHHAA